jgi:Ala-tRNA(Pro) deacylase
MDVQELLANRNIRFEVVHHPATEKALDVALAVHAPSHSVAKTVLLKADGGYAYVAAVVPADREVDLEKVGRALLGAKVELATPEEAAIQCPDYDGAVISPFGSQYNLKTLVDEQLAREEYVLFASNAADEAVRVRFDDFAKVENPIVAPLTREE